MRKSRFISIILVVLVVTASMVIPCKNVIASSPEVIYVESNDVVLSASNETYSVAHDAATGSVGATDQLLAVGQSLSSGTYKIRRSALYFDTSFLDALSNPTITSATLNLYAVTGLKNPDFYVVVTNGQPTYPHNPAVSGDYYYSNYSGDGGSVYTNGLDITQNWIQIDLNSTGISWISETGTTKLLLRSSRDISSTAPTSNEYVWFAPYEYSSGSYKAYLEIEYESDPIIDVDNASNVATTTARLNASVTDDGGESCEVRFGYGTTSQAAVDFDDYDTITEWDAGWDTGEYPYYDATGLTADTTYYYRAQIKNSDSTVTSTGETELTTINAISDPTTLSGIPYFDYNSLSWTIPSGATNVEIRYKTDTYPTSTSDGTEVYFGSLSTYSHTSLDSGKTYYYSMWGESGDSYSSNYITMALTTLGYSSASGDDIPVPIMPNQFDQTVDATGLYKLEPFYSAVAGFATSWGMPTNNMWVIIVVIISVLLACGVLVRTKKFGIALLTLCILWGIAVGLKLLPAYFIVFAICAGIGAWATSRES